MLQMGFCCILTTVKTEQFSCKCCVWLLRLCLYIRPAVLKNLEFVIADLVKKLEEQKADADRQLKVLSRQMKVWMLQYADP